MAFEFSSTINDKGFNKAFVEVHHDISDSSFSSGCNVRFFHLNLRNREFIREELAEYLRRNLSRYFHSRSQRMDLDLNGELDNASLQANEAILDLINDGMVLPSRELGAMLVYSFLEAREKAPKIMSCVEIEAGDYQRRKSRTDGMHLTKDGMVLLATSRIDSDLYSAVDEAVSRLGEIKKNTSTEIKIIKADIRNLMRGIDRETLESVIFPKDGVAASYTTGYGVFVGYNIGLEKGRNPERNYLETVEAKMRDGIIDCSMRIIKGLRENGFTGEEKIYFYFLPFDNVDEEVDAVFRDVIRGQYGRD